MVRRRRRPWQPTRHISAASGLGSAKPNLGEHEAEVPRELARGDVEAAVDHYIREAGADVALGFIDALEAAYEAISRRPAAGSPRYARALALPGLRSRALKRYPYLVFYIELDEHIAVWRVLHAHRDIPAWMQEPDAGGQ
ncbi:MAG TPA: type II toxin-antitoxin system RelE/ParE family toxin [Stellaceae bacterium]|nr:type II toxin-antitoxin system RelE/ParE family toxin [Stellaceae bacterium]